MGTDVVNNEEEEVQLEKDQEDKEIKHLYTTTLDRHRKILKGKH